MADQPLEKQPCTRGAKKPIPEAITLGGRHESKLTPSARNLVALNDPWHSAYAVWSNRRALARPHSGGAGRCVCRVPAHRRGREYYRRCDGRRPPQLVVADPRDRPG